MHVHSHFPGGPERTRGGTWPTPQEIRAIYDQLHIERSVLMSRAAPERMHDPITSRDAQSLQRMYPDTFGWWFCALYPRMLNNDAAGNFTYYLDYFKANGAKGVGELQANMYIDDPRMLNLLCHCEKSGLPVTIHFGKPGEGCGVADDLGLTRLEKVLEYFPKLTLIGHAMTFWSEIAPNVTEENRNGYPQGKIEKDGRVAILLRKHPNLFCDISAGSGLNALTRNPAYTYRFIDEFHERILFATDISSPSTIAQTAPSLCDFLDNGYKDGNISTRTYTNICRENACRILGISP